MRAIGPLVLSVVAIVAAGVVHGVWTDRWQPSPQLEQAVARLEKVPTTMGDWRGEDVPFEPEDMARAGIQGTVFRNYRNPRTREAVSVLLVCGRGGPLSVHTPDVCYAGAGYRQLTDAQSKEVVWGAGQKSVFWTARFGKQGIVPSQLEIYWAWSRDGRQWEAPTHPRIPFARLPALYKLYVVREVAVSSKLETTSPCESFLQRVLPEFAIALAPTE